MGGTYPGTTSDSDILAANTFPKEIQVDYIRVYEQTAPLQISAAQSNGAVILSWPTNIVCHLQVQTNSLVDGKWSDVSNVISPFILSPDPSNPSVFFRLQSP